MSPGSAEVRSKEGNVRHGMSIEGRRELLARIVPRYRDAGRAQRAVMLDEFVAATGYERKYAIRLLGNPPPPSPRARRRRAWRAFRVRR